MSILLEVAELGTFSREKGKQATFSPEGREGSVISMSMLQLAATRSA